MRGLGPKGPLSGVPPPSPIKSSLATGLIKNKVYSCCRLSAIFKGKLVFPLFSLNEGQCVLEVNT